MVFGFFLLAVNSSCHFFCWVVCFSNKQLTFNEPATSTMCSLIDLHDDIMFFLLIIIVFVLYMLVRTL